MALVVSLMSCESSLEDTYNEIGLDNTIVGDAVITLSEDDYIEEIGIANPYFESNDDAKELIPDYLSNRFPAWGSGSSVLVNYEIEFGTDLKEIVELTDATLYQLGLADYATSGNEGDAFYPDIIPRNISLSCPSQMQ